MGRKYLDEIGVSLEYDINDSRKEKFDKQREEYGFDEGDTWDLDTTFAAFIYERLKMFNEINIIDTDSEFERRYKFKGKMITLQECLDRMIEGFKIYLISDSDPIGEDREKVDDAMDIFRECWECLWW